VTNNLSQPATGASFPNRFPLSALLKDTTS